MNIDNAINEAVKVLKKNNIISAKLDSEILMSMTLKKNREYVILNLNEKLDQKKEDE